MALSAGQLGVEADSVYKLAIEVGSTRLIWYDREVRKSFILQAYAETNT